MARILHVDLGPLDALRQLAHSRSVTDDEKTLQRLREALGPRYDVLGELGRGGMAVVYLAHDMKLDRRVAVKLLPPEVAAHPETRDRFLREARTAARLAHPNIVPIHSVDQVGDLLFFTMDHVRGRTLAQRVEDDGPLSVGEATRIIHDAARAVGFAHRKGVVHRDLKPDNLMIEAETGRVIVMDFGLAGLYSEPPTNRPDVVIGTPAFLSPEQVQGPPGDERSDVYALGVTAHYAVTGRVPFEGDTVEEVFRQHVTVAAPRLYLKGANLDVTYARAVERCLEKRPDGRFADGDELAEELAKAPELRRADLPVPLRAYVDALNRYSLTGRGLVAVGGLASLEMLNRLARADWTPAAALAGAIVALAAGAAVVVLRATRRLFEAGHEPVQIVHALSVEVERERELHLFVDGEAARRPGRRARKVGYLVGGALLLLGAASSFVGAIDPVIWIGVMVVGAFVLGGAALIGHAKIRKRGDLPRNLWLEFWKGRGGRWAARLAALGLEREPARDATSQVPVVTALAASRIEKIRERLMVTDTAELRRRLEHTSVELERLPPRPPPHPGVGS